MTARAGARPLRLAFNPDAGPGPAAVVCSALAHVVLVLAVFGAARPAARTLPERFMSVRLVPGEAPRRATPPAAQRVAAPKPPPKTEPRRVEPPPEQALVAPPEPAVREEVRPPLAAGPKRTTEPPPEVVKPPPKPAPARRRPQLPPSGTAAPAGESTPAPEAAAAASAGAATAGAGVSAHVEEGDSPGDEYLARLVGRVSATWVKPRTGLPGQPAIVYFELSRTGVVRSVALESSSGSSLYDRAALRAVQLASPLPPLPPAYSAGMLKVHFEFIP